MKRAELEAAIQRLVEAVTCYAHVAHEDSERGKLIPARRELQDARGDLDDLLDVLDHELAFEPEFAITAKP